MITYTNLFCQYGFNYKPHFNYIVELNNAELVKKRTSESKLRQIKSSLKTGAIIVETSSLSELTEFYNILKKLYKEKVKKPLVEFEFFKKFYETPRLGKIFLIKKENKIIGGIVCPIFENKTIYEWYICGLDGHEKGLYPSVMATWAPIDYGLKNHIEKFDFMGAGSSDKDYGVREFKSKFGGILVENGRFLRINNQALYHLGQLGIKVLGKLKSI
jgi:lipid II:glycine glycyltransferase (peptidoglycan interpeptide bridge formation enzyme)